MVEKKWWMAVLSSGVIILSFFLLINANPSKVQETYAAFNYLSSGPNAFLIFDYSSGKIVTIFRVNLETPGYIVVQENSKHNPGAILGYSKLIPVGESMDVVVGLTRDLVKGEVVYVTLYLDDGDGKFNIMSDQADTNYLLGPDMMWFTVELDGE